MDGLGQFAQALALQPTANLVDQKHKIRARDAVARHHGLDHRVIEQFSDRGFAVSRRNRRFPAGICALLS